jgi:hypothetical protein
MTKRVPIAYIIITAILLIGFGTAAALGNISAQSTASRPRPPASCTSCNTHLLNMTLDQLGDYAVDSLKTSGSLAGASPEVLLTRMITREDYPAVGLGCPPDPSSIEQPPLALVILKGNLRYNGPGMQSTFSESHYAVIVLDLWAGAMTSQSFSVDGRGLAQILNDPTLPTTELYHCPPPLSTPMLNYGDTAPPIKLPAPFHTYSPSQSATLTAGPTNPVPPTPLEGLPTIPRPEPTTDNSSP